MCSSRGDDSPPMLVRVTGPHSNVGKTTLIERLVPALVARGLRVGTIKHTHHGFDLDHPGKDSYRHAIAGACATVLIGPDASAVLLRNTARMDLSSATAQLAGHVDIVLAEGFRSGTGFEIHIDPSAQQELSVTNDSIVLGAAPDELDEATLIALVDACTRTASGRWRG